ncbi:MAG: ribosome maturation factor RimP [Bacillus subtilis]|nr:ribosome maturation factor RimP [Bacillus subtilis]
MAKQENINKNEIIAKVSPVIEKIAHELGLVLLEVNFVKEAGNWHLRIFIYSQEHQITHEDFCEKFTKTLGDKIDALIPGHYYLEVSSPGIERKLKSDKEYNIFKGKQAEIKLKQPQDDLKVFMAKLVDYNEETGLIVELTENNKTMTIKKENISYVKLKS